MTLIHNGKLPQPNEAILIETPEQWEAIKPITDFNSDFPFNEFGYPHCIYRDHANRWTYQKKEWFTRNGYTIRPAYDFLKEDWQPKIGEVVEVFEGSKSFGKREFIAQTDKYIFLVKSLESLNDDIPSIWTWEKSKATIHPIPPTITIPLDEALKELSQLEKYKGKEIKIGNH